MMECPNCHCDNQDMLVGMGKNMMNCEACDHDFHETKVAIKKVSQEEFDKLEERMLKITKIQIDAMTHINEAIQLLNEGQEAIREYIKNRDSEEG